MVSELGGITQYSWVFTAYMLGSTVTVPLYGKLGDAHGRKPLFLVAISIFLVGSALCGAAQNMVQLVVFRAIQGIGAGGLFPLTLAFGEIATPLHVEARVNIILIISAVTCISLAHVLYYIAIRQVGVALSQTLQLLCPVGALGLSALFFGERFGTQANVGKNLSGDVVALRMHRRSIQGIRAGGDADWSALLLHRSGGGHFHERRGCIRSKGRRDCCRAGPGRRRLHSGAKGISQRAAPYL